MTPSPFSSHADLVLDGDLKAARLCPLAPQACAPLARAIVAMPPWSTLGYGAEAMTAHLAAEESGARRYVIEIGDEPAGAATIRHPWLKGPYVELLAVLPDFQARGIGGSFLRWLEQEALGHDARNLWVCASRFNERALRFYARHGFAEAAALPGLVADGFDEILLRKFPIGPSAGA